MKKLGIVAGRGNLPLQVIKACQEKKRPFYVLAFLALRHVGPWLPDWGGDPLHWKEKS